MKVTVDFTPEEYKKLQDMSKFRKYSIPMVLRAFAQNCQPGGSGWQHPSKSKSLDKKDDDKR